MSRLWSAALTMFVAARAYAQEPEPLAALGIPSLLAPTAAIADLRLWLEEGREITAMTPASKPRVGRSLLILSDVQFWIPVGVLVGGLLVLGWIH